MASMVDISGQQFGTLIAVKPNGSQYGMGVMWECQCICNHWLCPKILIVSGNNLRAGNSKTCDKHRFPKEMHRAIRQHYTNACSNAKKRNYQFVITPTQFHDLIKQPCYYCGSVNDIKRVKGFAGILVRLRANGIDRKDNTQGYTLENSVACCEWCNRAKDTLTIQEYLTNCKRVAGYHNDY